MLLDVRCPLLHLPTSLQDYVATLKPRKKCILVLTKVDLVPEEVAKAWKAYLQERYKFEVIMVESYKEHTKGENTQGELVPCAIPVIDSFAKQCRFPRSVYRHSDTL